MRERYEEGRTGMERYMREGRKAGGPSGTSLPPFFFVPTRQKLPPAGRRGFDSRLNLPGVGGSRDVEHIGSAQTDADLELLKAAARQRLAAGQGELYPRLPEGPANGGAVLPITSSRMGHLLDALTRGYAVLGSLPRRGAMGCSRRSDRAATSG